MTSICNLMKMKNNKQETNKLIKIQTKDMEMGKDQTNNQIPIQTLPGSLKKYRIATSAYLLMILKR